MPSLGKMKFAGFFHQIYNALTRLSSKIRFAKGLQNTAEILLAWPIYLCSFHLGGLIRTQNTISFIACHDVKIRTGTFFIRIMSYLSWIQDFSSV